MTIGVADARSIIQALTDFADQAVILPVFALAAVALLAMGWWRAALAWALAVPAVLAVVLAGKLAVFACGGEPTRAIGLLSPSGHTASAAVVYGGLLALLLRTKRRQLAALAASGMFAVLIGATRIWLGAHTLVDVLLGGGAGVAGAWVLVRLAGPRPPVLPYLRRAGLAIMLVAAVLHGLRLPAEREIANAAASIWPFSLCRLPASGHAPG